MAFRGAENAEKRLFSDDRGNRTCDCLLTPILRDTRLTGTHPLTCRWRKRGLSAQLQPPPTYSRHLHWKEDPIIQRYDSPPFFNQSRDRQRLAASLMFAKVTPKRGVSLTLSHGSHQTLRKCYLFRFSNGDGICTQFRKMYAYIRVVKGKILDTHIKVINHNPRLPHQRYCCLTA